jgi:LacI family transcriptional regulator
MKIDTKFNTISQHGVEIGEVAAKLLIDQESKEEIIPYETVVIKLN